MKLGLIYVQETREARYNAVRAILEDNIKLRDKSESRFQAFFEREINRLRNDFRAETEVCSLVLCDDYSYDCYIRFVKEKMMKSSRP